jgi:hypothetical protein
MRLNYEISLPGGYAVPHKAVKQEIQDPMKEMCFSMIVATHKPCTSLSSGVVMENVFDSTWDPTWVTCGTSIRWEVDGMVEI